MPSKIQQVKSEGQDAIDQYYNKMAGTIPFSGRKAIYRLSKDQYNKQPLNTVDPKSVARGFNPQVQPPTQRKPISDTRSTTNKPMWRNVSSVNIYDSTFDNGASQFKEQFTVIPIAGRNEGFKMTVDKRFYTYVGAVGGSGSQVKQANSFTKTTLSNVLGSMITNSGNSPQSTNAIRKASGAWK